MVTIALLFLSNIFMTFAWYGHLKFKDVPLWQVTLASWGLAAFEYMFQVPANRWGVPEDLGGAVVFLASNAASFITGQNLCVNGGLTVS